MWACRNSTEHKTFFAMAHVTQDWKIDESGLFLESINDCVEVTHDPSIEDSVTCSTCGSEAVWVEE